MEGELEILVVMRRTDVPQSSPRAVVLGQLVDHVPGEVPVLGDLPPELLHHLLVVIVIPSVPVRRTNDGLLNIGGRSDLLLLKLKERLEVEVERVLEQETGKCLASSLRIIMAGALLSFSAISRVTRRGEAVTTGLAVYCGNFETETASWSGSTLPLKR